MHGLQPAARLDHQRDRYRGLEAPHAIEHRGEVLALEERHHEVGDVGRRVDAVIEDRDDVRVVDGRADRRLPEEPRPALRGVPLGRGREEGLQGEARPCPVVRLEHGTHGAVAQHALERVPIAYTRAERRRAKLSLHGLDDSARRDEVAVAGGPGMPSRAQPLTGQDR